MIVTAEADALVLIEQEHHAHLTGDLAALLPRGHGDHAAFLAAARVHDNGWREADRAATVDADGRPHTFTTIDDASYEAVWRRGIARAAEVDPLVGLLVGLHGARFFASRTSAGMRALAREERERQDRVLADLGAGGTPDNLPAPIAEPSERIALLDALSLMLCGAITASISPSVGDERYTLTPHARGVTVRPWPFEATAPDLGVWARRVPRRAYASHDELRTALAAAPSAVDTVTLA